MVNGRLPTEESGGPAEPDEPEQTVLTWAELVAEVPVKQTGDAGDPRQRRCRCSSGRSGPRKCGKRSWSASRRLDGGGPLTARQQGQSSSKDGGCPCPAICGLIMCCQRRPLGRPATTRRLQKRKSGHGCNTMAPVTYPHVCELILLARDLVRSQMLPCRLSN